MSGLCQPIVAAINGPAVGVGVTLIPHCDIAYATKSAYFMTPFARIGVRQEIRFLFDPNKTTARSLCPSL